MITKEYKHLERKLKFILMAVTEWIMKGNFTMIYLLNFHIFIELARSDEEGVWNIY